MKKLLFLTLLSLMVIVAPFKPTVGLAAQSNPSIQDCIDNPKLCDDNTKKKTSQDISEVKSTKLTFFDYVKMIISFGIVIGLLYLVLYWIKRNGNSFSKNNVINSLGGTSVGSNKSVQILKIGNSLYVVGVGEDITLLKEISDQDEIQSIEELREQKTQAEVKVTKWFENVIKQDYRKVDSAKINSTKESFKNLFNQQMQSLKGKKNSILTRIDEKGIDKNE